MLEGMIGVRGAVGSWNGVAFTAWNGVAQTAWNGTAISCASSVTYLVKQDFEGTGYDNSETWTEVSTVIDEDFTPALVGTQSCQISGTAVRLTSPTHTARDEIWYYVVANMTTVSAGTVNWFSIVGPGFGIDRLSDGTIRVSGSQNGTPTSTTATIGTTYHFLIHYIKDLDGGAPSAFYSVEFNTSGTFDGSGSDYSQVTNGSETAQATNFRFLAEEATTVTYVVDKVRADDVAIGSSPP